MITLRFHYPFLPPQDNKQQLLIERKFSQDCRESTGAPNTHHQRGISKSATGRATSITASRNLRPRPRGAGYRDRDQCRARSCQWESRSMSDLNPAQRAHTALVSRGKSPNSAFPWTHFGRRAGRRVKRSRSLSRSGWLHRR